MPAAVRGGLRMPLVTVRPCWGELIAAELKTVENRNRPCGYRGPVGIHTSVNRHRPGECSRDAVGYVGEWPCGLAPAGHVVAVVDLVDCHLANGQCCGRYGMATYGGRRAYHLVLRRPRLLARPVYASGALNLPWWADEDVTARVVGQVCDLAAELAAAKARP